MEIPGKCSENVGKCNALGLYKPFEEYEYNFSARLLKNSSRNMVIEFEIFVGRPYLLGDGAAINIIIYVYILLKQWGFAIANKTWYISYINLFYLNLSLVTIFNNKV